jgi:hypothetical protein
VTFNGQLAVPSSWSNTAISVPVPTGATTGNIVVTVNGFAGRGYPFMVTPASQPPGVHFIQGDYLASDTVPSTTTVAFLIAQTAGNLNLVVVGWRGAYVRIAEYSGLNATSPLDVVAAAGGTGTTADSGFATTTNQNDVLVGAGMADGVISGAGSNYILRVIPIKRRRWLTPGRADHL